MSIKNIDLLIDDDQTVRDILNDLDDVAAVRVIHGYNGSTYTGEEEIDSIPVNILNTLVKSYRVSKRDIGYFVMVVV